MVAVGGFPVHQKRGQGVLIDSHCHVDQFPHPEEIVRECEKTSIRVVAVTNLPSDFAIAADRLKGHPYVWAALGMHPLMATKAIRELSAFRRLVPYVDYVGEIGLDYSSEGIATKAVQDRVFEEVLGSLGDRHRFITLHSRGAASEILARLQAHRIQHAVFHWFTGSAGELDKIVDAGHLVSINGAMLRSSKGISLVRRVPREAILIETDGPFSKIGDRASKPADVKAVYEKLSVQTGCAVSELMHVVSANFARAKGR
jgi:TatD DNase family protein